MRVAATRIAGAKFVWSSMENVKVQYVDDAIGATFENAKLGGSSVIEVRLLASLASRSRRSASFASALGSLPAVPAEWRQSDVLYIRCVE
eukprot:2795605-Pleurochrysis_carterae.AAC.2